MMQREYKPLMMAAALSTVNSDLTCCHVCLLFLISLSELKHNAMTLQLFSFSTRKHHPRLHSHKQSCKRTCKHAVIDRFISSTGPCSHITHGQHELLFLYDTVFLGCHLYSYKTEAIKPLPPMLYELTLLYEGSNDEMAADGIKTATLASSSVK